MGDDWEDWEDELPPLPTASANTAGGEKTKGELLLAKEREREVDMSKFEGEDEGEEEEPAWTKSVPKTEQKKEIPKKAYEKRGVIDQGEPLEDPVAEKLRLAKLQEQSDLHAARDLFGTPDIDLNTFVPQSAKDLETLARAVVLKFVLPYEKDAKFKSLLKTLLKESLANSDVQQVKDLESALAGIRAEKLKEEKAAAAAKKAAGKKKTLNVGRGGGSAGLDDYQYDNTGDADDDFM